VVSLCSADLSGDVMSIEVEATDMLVDLGEGVKALNRRLSCLHHLAMHTLRSPWDVLNFGCLQAQQTINQSINQSINQQTFLVFGTQQGSRQTITGKMTYTKH